MSWVSPMPAVATPVRTSPAIIMGFRPRLSASFPETVSAAALPPAKTASAHPAAAGPAPSAATAKSGTVAMRTPKVAQPLAKLEKRPAR